MVINGFNAAETVCHQSRQALETHYQDYLAKTVIRKSTAFTRSTAVQKPVFEYDPGSKAAQDVDALVREILGLDHHDSDERANGARARR